MTFAPGRAAGRWARCGDALSYTTSAGTVVLAADGRTAVTLSSDEHTVWALAVEPVTEDALASLADGTPARAALASLAALGIVSEVP